MEESRRGKAERAHRGSPEKGNGAGPRLEPEDKAAKEPRGRTGSAVGRAAQAPARARPHGGGAAPPNGRDGRTVVRLPNWPVGEVMALEQAAARSSVDALGLELGKAVAPLESLLSSPEEALRLLKVLGWDAPPGVDDIGLSVDVGAVIDQLEVIERSTPDERKDPAVMGVRYGKLLA